MNSIITVLLALQDRFAGNDERGATATEYALLVGLIAVFITAGVGLFGTALNTYFTGLFASLGI